MLTHRGLIQLPRTEFQRKNTQIACPFCPIKILRDSSHRTLHQHNTYIVTEFFYGNLIHCNPSGNCLSELAPNGLCYLRVGGRGFCSGTEKTRSQKNTRKCGRIPHVRCTLCSAARGEQLCHPSRCISLGSMRLNFKVLPSE